MKGACFRTYVIAAVTLASIVSSFLVVPDHPLTSNRRILNNANQQQLQLSPDMSESKNPPVVMTNGPIMSDAMAIQRDVSIFAEFVRSSETVTNRLEDIMKNTTVLAPLNSVVKKLPRKPWEDPEGSDSFHGQAGEDRAARNIERFVEAHIIPVSPWEERQKVKTLGGRELWWENDGDDMVINPGGIKVSKIATSVSNGQIWTVEAVINY